MRHQLFAVFCVLLTVGGCQCEDVREERPWDLGVAVDADSSIDTTDAVELPDTVDTHVTDSWDVPPDVPDVCDEPAAFEVTYFRTPFMARRAPRVSRGTVFTQQQTDGDLEIVAVEPSSGRARALTDNAVEDQLAATADGRALVYRSSGMSRTVTPVIVDGAGGERVIGDFSDRATGVPIGLSSGVGRMFDGRTFAAILENDPNAAPGWVGYFDGEESREVHVKDWTQPPVAVTPDGFLVVGRTGPLSGGGNLEIYEFRRNEGIRRLTRTNPYERDVTASDSAAFWNTDQGVVVYDYSTGETETIKRGMCSPVSADGARAIFSCESDSASTNGHHRPVFGRDLYLYDGRRVRTVPTAGGYVYKPRLDGSSAVWVEYDDKSEFEMAGSGRIYYWRQGMDAPTKIDDIGAPCMVCDALYPDVNLSISEGVVAWNYANPGRDNPRLADEHGGVATLVGGCESVR